MRDDYTKTYPVTKVDRKKTATCTSFSVAREENVELYINGSKIASILTSPVDIKELAVGYVICEGIADFADITRIYESKNRIDLEIVDVDSKSLSYELRSSGYMGISAKDYPTKIQSDVIFEPESIFSSQKFLESGIYRLTKGTHLAALINQNGELVTQAVDIGRHNAIDKVIGYSRLAGLDVSSLYLLSTGRQSNGMVLKCSRSGVSLLVTKSAPLDSGIETAKKTGLCLVGFASESRMYIFANPERINFDDNTDKNKD
ncbi:formate dehydrogenase family accessory protein FdhD [Methanohalobium evestigatum Z-7303]|uniref:Protein FdhD n=1 Tax=Methanohalobium evestigatum (strain ATCC BAA-1072 / DSM 3721 / NBRC 107634 / OCM 161 / Z-7303) TaxID=644295 RepID=D7EBN5_METEZ|nr:formate dehydrogenase accessory sulfurtransferase FdhD [Methanohalobium evestigatum]ADI74877.1 formate dehydrogenase family accessory protein FdhD [Methanohalobium evestigatum Z-7303]